MEARMEKQPVEETQPNSISDAANALHHLGKAVKDLSRAASLAGKCLMPLIDYWDRAKQYKEEQRILRVKQFTIGLTYSERCRQVSPPPKIGLFDA